MEIIRGLIYGWLLIDTVIGILLASNMIGNLRDEEMSLRGLHDDIGYIAQTFYIIAKEGKVFTPLAIIIGALVLVIPTFLYIVLYLVDLLLLIIDIKFL